MAWNVEETKAKIRRAALASFSEKGLSGTTMEGIARSACVNKERVYAYFGGKDDLFVSILREEMARLSAEVPVESFAAEDIGDYAGRLFDYHQQHPELNRLVQWEGLACVGDTPDEQSRSDFYADRISAMRAGQEAGVIRADADAAMLVFQVLSLVGWWSAVPQIGRMVTGAADDPESVARRRAAVVDGARRICRNAL